MDGGKGLGGPYPFQAVRRDAGACRPGTLSEVCQLQVYHIRVGILSDEYS